MQTITPYEGSNKSKRQQIENMFDNIAPKYDLLNHSLTVGIDKIWRRKAIKIATKNNPNTILDIAAGTGDFSILEAEKTNAKITAIDISQKMLDIAKQKASEKKLNNIVFQKADSLDMPFDDNTFDTATISFGVRNFCDIPAGLSEILRVLKPGGTLVVLELSEPPNPIVKSIFDLYFHKILPFIGKKISKDDSAYKYLPKSVENFPYGQRFVEIMNNCKYQKTGFKWLSLGIAAIYWGVK